MRRIGVQRAAFFLFVAFMFMTAVCFRPDGASAKPKDLLLPLDCEPGRTCWVVRYVDHEPGPDAGDYACGPMDRRWSQKAPTSRYAISPP